MLIGGAPVGISWLLVAGVIRLVENICLGAETGLEGAGVRGFGGACMMCPRGVGPVMWTGVGVE
jgi:hypothetical protein